jgi:hypothetical protein
MISRATDPAFERALGAEILASEQIRVRALVVVLGRSAPGASRRDWWVRPWRRARCMIEDTGIAS